MFGLTWKIQGDIKISRHPFTTHTSYGRNANTMEYPICHLHFLRIHTVFKLTEIHVQVTYVLFHVVTIIIIIVSLSQCA